MGFLKRLVGAGRGHPADTSLEVRNSLPAPGA